MQVTIHYNKNIPLPNHEIIIRKLCLNATHVLELPNTIDICLYILKNDQYGGIDKKRINRLVLNYYLPIRQIPKILVHELIHVNQRYTNKLEITKDGWYIWQKKYFLKKDPQCLTYEQYLNLPWEVDVQCRLNTTLQKILDIA